MPKLLVTGASGFLGGALVTRAREAGWDVAGTAHTRPSPGDVVVDVRDAAAVGEVVRAAAPDAVIHTAYVQNGDAAMAVNADGAAHVATAARAAGARLIHVSSDAIFAGDGDRPLAEDAVPAPVTEYGKTKAAAEPLVIEAHPGALLARTSLLLGGPGHAPSPHELLALAAARGEQDVSFFTDEIRSPVQVGDLAAALVELATMADVTGPLHLGGADAVSRLELARLVVAAHGLDPAGLRDAPAPPGRPRFCPMDSSLAARLVTTRLRGAREVYAARPA
ncbi:MAG TPA: SDR family oxidoreductase [Baekduia sp.]|nr:SDR family oxidoreductase [Baekduia sp.]